jgi:beta-glucosidase
MPASFLYGAATSAHQVEGNNVNSDWWAWEQANAKVQKSGRAADHYHRYKEDFALAKSLGHTAHRLSIEWSRIELKHDVWNQAALRHYRQVLQELKRQGLVSFVTLHHFTNPQWFARRGGWRRSDAPELFAHYVRRVVQELGGLVDFWVTINEPLVYATQSFWHKKWPPQQHSAWATWQVVRHLASAHRRAYRIIHTHWPEAQVGMAKNLIAFAPDQKISEWWFNRLWYPLTAGTHDFLGVNYYFSSRWDAWKGDRSDMNWPIDPEGLTKVLLPLRQYRRPIYITENGVADARDSKRADFIRSHLKAVEAAQAQGCDVRGYFYWSLIDNFEWADGFGPRFGLAEVDYTTMKRTIRPSARVYQAIIEQAQR